jgi:hypothetical protein
MVSFFAREENLSMEELDGIRRIMKKEIKKQKGKQP